jgi:hypothetical protein
MNMPIMADLFTFDDVVAYIALYDPRFPESIAGAGDDQIAELETLIKVELPSVYRGFLSTMGRNMGWIDIQRLDLRIETVLDYYRRPDALPVKEFLRIGTDTKEPSYNPHLQLSLVAPEFRVVAFPPCTREFLDTMTSGHLHEIAGSVQQMVCRPVFRIFEIFGPGRRPLLIRARSFVYDHARQIAAILERDFGVEAELWSSEVVRGYKSGDMAVELSQLGRAPAEMLLRVNGVDEQLRTAASFARMMGGEVLEPSPPSFE